MLYHLTFIVRFLAFRDQLLITAQIKRANGKETFKFVIAFHSNIYPTRCNVTQFILPRNCSTYFGWYHHPSPGAQTTVSTANLHVSSGTSTNHQERKQLRLQHLVFVTPLLLSAAIVKEFEQV
jgi:hypothetical protein